MKHILLLYIVFQVCTFHVAAQRKYLDKGCKLLKEAKEYQQKNATAEAAKKAEAKIIWKYKDAGNTFLKADTGLVPEEKLVAQYFALVCFNKAQEMMLKAEKYKDVAALADNVIPHLWMRTEKLPKPVKWDSIVPAVTITLQDFIALRDRYLSDAMDGARLANEWKAMQRLEPFYLTILPEPQKRGDVTEFNKRMDAFYWLAYASGMNKDAPACRDNVYNFYEYVLKKRMLIEDKRRMESRCADLDSLFHTTYFNYTDFDDNIKVRPLAAKVFEKLDDSPHAYRLFDESVNSGSKSIALLIGRMNVAAEMQDLSKLEVSLKPFQEKKYSGELTKEQEKRVRECKSMLRKEM